MLPLGITLTTFIKYLIKNVQNYIILILRKILLLQSKLQN